MQYMSVTMARGNCWGLRINQCLEGPDLGIGSVPMLLGIPSIGEPSINS